jgi:TolB-like protein/DNA-binding SARP family transcriptional activator/Flp pilus assembly protein TadD
MAEFRLTLLGSFALSASAPCAMLSKKAQALLAFLAIPPGQAHRRDKLASMLWSDRSEESARQNLRQCLMAIRRACGGPAALPVVTEADSLRLDTARVTVDVCEFEEALHGADPAALHRAFALYRGELLEGLRLQDGPFEEWLIGERRRLGALASTGLGQLLQHHQRCGAHEEAIQTALRLLTIDPFQEAVHRTLMRLYHETGNTAQALRQFGICEKILRRELNVEPEVATRELRRDILRSRSLPRSAREDSGVPPVNASKGDRKDAAAGTEQGAGGLSPPCSLGQGSQVGPDSRPLPSASEILRELDAPVVPSDRPSVAVIPFHSYSDDPRHAALADAICEDITTTLSGLSRLMVIACSSSLCYKDKKVGARRAGQELGVAHVLEGSVRASGDRVRISAQLVDTSSGAHVWADRYDRDIGDAFGVPDEITQEIVTALEVKLTHGEQIRAWRRDAASPEAYQHFVRGREAYLTFSRSAMGRAREELEKAISINTEFATAYVLLGFTHAEEARFQWGSNRDEALSKARDAAGKALTLNGGCGAAHSLLAYVAMQDRRFEDAIEEGGRAVAIGPSDADAYHVLAMARIYNGDFAEGVRLERRSLRLNPLALENHLVMLARAYFHMDRYDDAIGVLDRVCQRKPYWLSSRTLLAGSYAQSGRLQLAGQAAAHVLRIRPDFSTARWAELQPYRRKEDLQRYLSSLHAAGLPVGSKRGLAALPEGGERGDAKAASELPAVVADRPSLAVLPFENLSEQPVLGLIADGLVEDVLTLLARVPGFFVIARRSSFFYRDRPHDIRQVGRELGIRYVVAGSIRGSGDRVRIVVNLFEADGGKQHWAAQYDIERGDALELQDKIAGDIIAELQPQLTRAELTKIRRQRPDNLDAWALYHQAIGELAHKGLNESGLAESLAYLRKACAIDPDFALAHGLTALWTAVGANLSLLPDVAARHTEARRAVERAIALDPDGPEVLGYAGCALVDMGDLVRGREILERALELDPSNAQARVALGATQVLAREYDRGIEDMRLGIRLSPRDNRLTFWGTVLADALAKSGRLDDALKEARSMCRRDRLLYTPRIVLASVLTRLGRLDEARAAVLEARRIRPTISLDEVKRFFGRRVAAELLPVWT